MLFDKIISQYDEHNEALLFLIDKFPINKIIFIIDKAQESKIKEDTIMLKNRVIIKLMLILMP